MIRFFEGLIWVGILSLSFHIFHWYGNTIILHIDFYSILYTILSKKLCMNELINDIFFLCFSSSVILHVLLCHIQSNVVDFPSCLYMACFFLYIHSLCMTCVFYVTIWDANSTFILSFCNFRTFLDRDIFWPFLIG